MTEKDREFKFVEAGKLYPSTLLPSREYSPELVDIIKKQGIQQPIIVRPHPFSPRFAPDGSYEIIDGHLRRKAVEDDQLVLVDVRKNVSDEKVFEISEDTFKRKMRSVYERAMHYSSWVRAFGAQFGVEGAQKEVAAKSGFSEASISYYVSVGNLFRELSGKISEPVLNALKIQSVNKLYELCKVEELDVKVKLAVRLADAPDMTLKELRRIVEEEVQAASSVGRLERDDEETEKKKEEARMCQLKDAAKELESFLEVTAKSVSNFRSNLDSNPHVFLSSEVFQKIQRMLEALKRIEKEANRLVGLRTS